MIFGNILSLTIYTIIVLFVAITTGIAELYLISIVNFVLIIYQYSKQKKSIERKLIQEQQKAKVVDEISSVKAKAKHNIEVKYKNSNLSEAEKKDLIWEEYIRLMRERK